ncbi:uncharacterized protein LOC144918895 [Branchiostoma floridae x Branchiostoma belcheri]
MAEAMEVGGELEWGDAYGVEGVQPYQFEPEAAEGEDGDPEAPDRGNQDRRSNRNWCRCDNCRIMATTTECVCCQEHEQIRNTMEGVSPAPKCITMHPGFSSVCLDIWALQCAYYQYRQEYGPSQDPTHERYRYIAYRQLVRWCWGWLGREVRVVLPACAVTKIRDTFPSAQYTGFQYPPLN